MKLTQRIANAIMKLSRRNIDDPYAAENFSTKTLCDYDKYQTNNQNDLIAVLANQFRMDGRDDIARAMEPVTRKTPTTLTSQFQLTAEDELIIRMYEIAEDAKKLELPFIITIRLDDVNHLLVDTPAGTPFTFYKAIQELVSPRYE